MYGIYKLGSKTNQHLKGSGMVMEGYHFNVEKIDYLDISDKNNVELKTMKNVSDVVGTLAYFQSSTSMFDDLRTSIVQFVYEQGKEIGTSFSEDFPKEDLERLEYPELKEGDILFATLNSIYLAKKIDR